MSNILQMQHQIQLLRLNDRVKELTYPQTNSDVSAAAMNGLLSLLETHDYMNSRGEIKFWSRTLFLTLALSEGDAILYDQNMELNIKSSLFTAYRICLNPEEFDHFLHDEKISQLFPYYSSQQHQHIENKILQLVGSKLNITTPYHFAHAVKGQIEALNFETAVSYLIDFALTISDSNKFTSEEIFVACCLLLSEKDSSGAMLNMLNYFGGCQGRGEQLMVKIKEQMEQVLVDEI